MKVVVGRVPKSPRRARRAVDASKRPRIKQVPPRSNVPAAKRIETEWYIGEQTRCTSSAPKDQRSASSANTTAAVASSQTPDHTPFACPVVPEV